MTYKTKSGQTSLDVMIQNKGSLDPDGLAEFIDGLTSVTQKFFAGEVLTIEREENAVTNLFDSKDLTAVSTSLFQIEPPILSNLQHSGIKVDWILDNEDFLQSTEIYLSDDDVVFNLNGTVVNGVTTFNIQGGLTGGDTFFVKTRVFKGAVFEDFSGSSSILIPQITFNMFNSNGNQMINSNLNDMINKNF